MLAALAVVALYALALNPYWRYQRDSAAYLTLARSLLEGRGYTGSPVAYPPGFPLMLAAIGKVSGMPQAIAGGFLPMNAAVSALGLGLVGLMWLILRELSVSARERAAVIALVALSRTLYYYSTHIMTDVPFACCALAVLYCGLRMRRATGPASWAWASGAGVLVAAASSLRPLGPVLALALSAGIWLRRGSPERPGPRLARTALILLPMVAALIAWAALREGPVVEHLGAYFRGRVRLATLAALPGRVLLSSGDHLSGISESVTGAHAGTTFGALLCAIAGVGLVRSLRRANVAFTAFGILCIGAIAASGWPLGRRYMLPVLPVVFYWLVLGASGIGEWLGRRGPFWTAARLRVVGHVCLGLMLSINLLRVSKVVQECRSPDFYRAVEKGRMVDYAALTDWLREHAEPDWTLLTHEHTTVGYFGRVRTAKLSRDTRDQKLTWLRNRVRENDVSHVVRDDRRPKAADVLHRLQRELPSAVELVFRAGELELLAVDGDALP